MSDCNIEQTVSRAKGKIPYYYGLSLGELTELCEFSRESLIHALIMAYEFGFCRGTRAKDKNRVPVL